MDAVTPSRMNLALYQQKTIAAKKGHELLKKKCDALKAKMREIMIKLIDTKKNMGQEAADALYSFAQAIWAAGEIHQNVRDIVKKASIRVRLTSDNVGGVQLPRFQVEGGHDDAGDNQVSQLGVERGGAQVVVSRNKFKSLVETLILIAGYQTSFITLDRVIKVTNRRVNALEHIVIPRFIATQVYILQELDEMSKEEFFRLKKVLQNKKQDQEIEQAAKDKRIAQLKAKGIDVEAMGGEIVDLDDNDEDVIV